MMALTLRNTRQQTRYFDESDIQHPSLELRLTKSKGLGLFAKTEIKRGARIISEGPLIIVTAADAKASRLWKHLEDLTPADLDRFDSLHCNKGQLDAKDPRRIHNAIFASRRFAKCKEWKDKIVEIESHRLGIWKTNALPLGTRRGFGIFPLSARINHSFMPNVFRNYNRSLQRFTVHAIRDIKAGEEITASYINPAQPADQRNEDLEAFCIDCECDDCEMAPTSRQEKLRGWLHDRARGLKAFEGKPKPGKAVPDSLVPRNVKEALRMAEESVDLLQEAGLNCMILALAHRQCSKYCLQLGLLDKAKHHAQREQYVERWCMGVETEYLNDGKGDGNAELWMKHVLQAEMEQAPAMKVEKKKPKKKRSGGRR